MNLFIINYLVLRINIIIVITLLGIGFLTGILSGLLGIGGGVIFVPTFIFLLPLIGIQSNIVIVSAIATSLFAGSLVSASSFYNHKKQKNVALKEGLILGIGTIIPAVFAPKVIVSLHPVILKIIIAAFIFIVALKLLLGNQKKERFARNINPYLLFPIGIFFGGIAAISGLGGGIFYVPIFLYFLKGNLKLSIGTSTIAIFLTMFSSTVSFAFLNSEWNSTTFQFGYLNVASALLIGVGAIVGTYFGVKLIFKVPVSIFRRIFSVFLLLVIIKILLSIN